MSDMKTVFIDGRAGTTGLRIEERLRARDDLTLLTLPDDKRKDAEARRAMLNAADVVFLCLPDDAAREAVSMIDNDTTVVIDASTAHRTAPGWAYGFPELGAEFETRIREGRRIAVPGCHAGGFIALVYPLIRAGLLSPDVQLCAHSITGYSGGGKSMIAGYESDVRDALLDAPRQYGIAQAHKHLPEMRAICGLQHAPIFCPIVADFYSGMEMTVPLFREQLRTGNKAAVEEVYRTLYTTELVQYVTGADEGGFLSAAALSGKDCMTIEVHGNEERMLLVARYDNLGKGASGAAVECLNVKLGCQKTKNLVL